ncbi:hydroxy-delta-5-steroid dehydrogenase, 3 beta- and steroid delta-isomerase 1 [Callorhinchus milii]|uniref:3 beta-hydroxysteroid dehydrogenase n=1 Tax=Callorhinchus milii TaxID=7868 RepID=V9KNF5_CALMI|nr:hydroxy-delta-5-steroid dehydrogenase, 3 beta- and steroid delta-isomerase 1 [Callorhinchus milii]|eukprot:gi/632956663/ref/XP_007894069.1/ PREDICTED: 3 beta-hydroxysteroid dehydrogenase/Delta 5--_4-isomerase-like [Callorhinchus milii]
MQRCGDVYLVTGGNGFLGQQIVKLLMKEMENLAEVRILDKLMNQDFVQFLEGAGYSEHLHFFKGDLRNKELVQRACRGVTCVIHSASVIDVWGYISKEEIESINVEGTRLLLETCLQQNVKSFIYTSTVEVMGPNSRGDPIRNGDEDTIYPITLKFEYSKTKHRAEQLTLRSNGWLLPNGEKMITCALRPMYIYGEMSRFLVQHLDEAINNGDVLVRSSKKEALVNPVYVGNVAWAHVLVAKAFKDPENIVGGQFYYITDDTTYMSYSDFNYKLMKPLGIQIESHLKMPLILTYFIAFIQEVFQFLMSPFFKYTPKIPRQLITMLNTEFTFSSHKAYKDFGYTPRYSWEEARQRTTAWLESILQERRDVVKKKQQPCSPKHPK